jgi:hypothetical protein
VMESNHQSFGYEPNELPFLRPAMSISFKMAENTPLI